VCIFARGARATDHDVPDLATERLPVPTLERLLTQALEGSISRGDGVRLHDHMLIEMAELSVQDGLVMQLHVGVRRSTNGVVHASFGPNVGDDISQRTDRVLGLDALLNRVGNAAGLTIVAFTKVPVPANSRPWRDIGRR